MKASGGCRVSGMAHGTDLKGDGAEGKKVEKGNIIIHTTIIKSFHMERIAIRRRVRRVSRPEDKKG